MSRSTPRRLRNIVGASIREMRRQMRPRISQEDLCGRVARYGVTLTRTQIAKLESGTRPVFDYEVLAIAKALKIPIERLYAK